MIVWGGRGASGSLATGARYCAGNCSTPPPAGSPALTASASGTAAVISWTALAGATAYDLVKGALRPLGLSGGNFTTSTTGCLADDTAGRSFTDPDLPVAGDGFWYLVRGVACGGGGTYDEGSPYQHGSRDAEIDASPNACR